MKQHLCLVQWTPFPLLDSALFGMQGEFETLGGDRVHFGPAPRGFTECRGVVLRNKEDHLVSDSV